MRWDDVEVALVEALTLASGVKAHWTKATSAWRAKQFIRMDLLSLTQAGPAEKRLVYEYEPPTPPDALPPVDGFRQYDVSPGAMTVQIAASSQSQRLADSALAIAHRARASLDLEEVRSILGAANLALASLGDVVDISVRDVEGRFVSEAMFEARINVATVIEGAPINRFVEVVTRGELRNVGTPDSAPPDWILERTDP